MSYYLDIEALAAFVKAQRLDRGLRETSKDIGISASTLSRVERRKVPDIETFLALCNWLGCEPNFFIKSTEEVNFISVPDAIAIQLQTDPNLDPVMAKVLSILIKAAYGQLAQ